MEIDNQIMNPLIAKENAKNKDYYKKVEGRYVCRMLKDDGGMYKDEYREFEDGKKYLVVFPYNKNRAEKHNFRELTLEEIEEHFINIGKKQEEMPKDFLLRKLKQLEKEKEDLAKKPVKDNIKTETK